MSTTRQRLARGFRLGLVVLLAWLAAAPLAAGRESDEVGPAADLTLTVQNYATLTDLVSRVCGEAIRVFQGFYSNTGVEVSPFTVLGEGGRQRPTILGATMADQMQAVVNNDVKMQAIPFKSSSQRMQGVLQEMDGFLRIHITGVNAWADRRSYVVNVEMSEPIYRALHTYAKD